MKRKPKDKRDYKNEHQIAPNIFYNQNGNEASQTDHPTPKPVALIRTLLRASSNKGDKVFSPFLGSGTDAVACHLEKRSLVGCEIDKDYYDAAVKRYNNHKKQLTIF